MGEQIIRRILSFVVVVLLQVLVFNHLCIGGCAQAMVYLFFLLSLSGSISRNALLLWGFVLGLAVDVLSNSWGAHAMATTFLAFLRPALLRAFVTSDDATDIVPGMESMGASAYVRYAALCVAVHHAVFFAIEWFSTGNTYYCFIAFLLSTLLTTLCLTAFNAITRQR